MLLVAGSMPVSIRYSGFQEKKQKRRDGADQMQMRFGAT